MRRSKFEDYFNFEFGLPMAGSIIDPDSLGYIYIIGFSEPGIVKVGTALNVGLRLTQLQCGNPFELNLCCAVSIYDTNPALIEFAAHRELKDHNIRGEWFSVEADTALKAVIKCARNMKAKFAAPIVAYETALIDSDTTIAAANEERRREMRQKMGID